MDIAEYINSVVGTPWVEGKTDCYWLVEDSYLHLDGIELPQPPWRTVDGAADSGREMLASGQWKPCRVQEGAVFAIYNSDGALKHVGRILAGLAVHSDGTLQRAGQCRAERISDMEKLYRRLGYTVKYYTYEGANG